MMTPDQFNQLYRRCFGDNAPLPLAVVYSDEPMSEPMSVPGCMFKQLHKANSGGVVTYTAQSLNCGGGRAYTGLDSIPDYVFNYVSIVEKYKTTPEVAKKAILNIESELSGKPFLNILRTDNLKTFEDVEGLVFLVTPDILSGLFAWANYDTSDLNSVQVPWGSGCSSAITFMVNENKKGGSHCYIGMLDVSARPFFRRDILSFSIPMSRLKQMMLTLSECCVLDSPAWQKVRKRIDCNN